MSDSLKLGGVERFEGLIVSSPLDPSARACGFARRAVELSFPGVLPMFSVAESTGVRVGSSWSDC